MRSTPARQPARRAPTSLPAELRARATALDALAAVLGEGKPLDELRAAEGLDARDRGFAKLLAATVLRRLGQIDAVVDRCLDSPLAARNAAVRDVLRLGAAQLLFLDTPAHAAVDSSVELVRAYGREGFAGLTNAILRRIGRDGAGWRDAQDAARLNTPDWLWDSWARAYGESVARKIAGAHLVEPPLDLSVADDPAGWAARLGGSVLPTGSVRVPAEGRIEDLPGFAEGRWWVQDAAAALPAKLLGDVRGKSAIDLCAAPGGKTAQLAAAGAQVVAVERSPRRTRRLRENLARLNLAAEIVTADAESWTPARAPEAVLLDAPCSATGTIRRHPDALRIKRADDLPLLTAAQDRLLAAAAAMLAPGGVLVYAVCSLQPEEGPARIAALLNSGAPLVRDPIRPEEIGGMGEWLTAEGELRTFPFHLAEHGGMDAFFAARLVRQ